MDKITAPRGTRDMLPNESHEWQYVEAKLRDVARRFGFKEIRFPTFEDIALFKRGVGDTTDVVQKEMYDFFDKGGRHIALRPEGTASVVRSFIEHSLDKQGLPVKVYYIAPNFRYEKPQAGRLREHHQFGVEYFGSRDASSDAEVIMLANVMLSELGIKNVKLEINSCGCPECRPDYHKALKAYFETRGKSLCETCNDRLVRNPMRILDCKSPECRKEAEGAPVITDFLCQSCVEHFEKLQSYLKDNGISFEINPHIVRGLDYYTNTVFEFISGDIGAQSTVCGGGRYNGLVQSLGGPEIAGLGFGCGLERLILTIKAQDAYFPEPDTIDIFIANAGGDTDLAVTKLIYELRRAGIPAERDTLGRSLKAQMKYADKLNAKFSAVVGEDELKTQTLMIKRMSDGEKESIKLNAAEIASYIKNK
jgi:histidyl-tRNA synthetase